MSELDQGTFVLGFPDGFWRKIPIFVCIFFMIFCVIGMSAVNSAFEKMPRVSDAYSDVHPLDVTEDMAVNLVPNDPNSKQVVWVVADSISLQDADVGYTYCQQGDDSETLIQTFNPGRYNATYRGEDFVMTIQEPATRSNKACYAFTYGKGGDVEEISAYFMVEFSSLGEPLITMEGMGESDQRPARKTASETVSLFFAILISIASFVCVLCFKPPLQGKLKKMREEHMPQPRIHADQNGVRFAQTHAWNGDDFDWVLDPSPPANWDLTNPYAQDLDGEIIPEHPAKIGTPRAAVFTLYSFFGILYVCITSLWIGNFFQREFDGFANQIYQPIIFIISMIWLIISYTKTKKIRAALDTPTSLVRSVAAGMAEIVGQVRPAREGTGQVLVGGEFGAGKLFDGVVAFTWEREIWETRKTGDKSTTKWWSEAKQSGGGNFIVHDGSGGILVEGNSFKVELGNFLSRWEVGKKMSFKNMAKANRPRRFTVYALRAGDPVYVYGKAYPRPKQQVLMEGLDGSLANSNLVMKGESDTPSKPVCHRGTELAILCNSRSTVETVIIPGLASLIAFVMIFI